jgi:hypothetical protein
MLCTLMLCGSYAPASEQDIWGWAGLNMNINFNGDCGEQ